MSGALSAAAVDDPGLSLVGRPCRFVDERDTGTWECINEDCVGGHWFRRIDTDDTEGNDEA